MKKYLFFVLILVSIISCSKEAVSRVRELSYEEQLSVSGYEKNYIDKLQRTIGTKSERQNDVVLIGFKTISFHGPDSVFVNKLWNTYKDEIAAYGSFLPLDGQARIYFPLSNAIVRCNGAKHIADSAGVISCSNIDLEHVSVVGRDKTDKSIFTKFRHPYKPSSVFPQAKVLIFDLGSRPLDDSMHEHNIEKLATSEDGNGKVSCVQNHGSYANCTVAYMIAQPRCATDYNRCMDYNGFGTDCSGNKIYFLGSDCSVALSMGYCWNELMD